MHDVFAHQSWNSLSLLDLANYIVENLVGSYTLPEQNIKISVQGQEVRIPDSQAVSVALVLNELVTNSLKHGIKEIIDGEISIFIEESEGIVHVVIADTDNQGDVIYVKKEGLGLYLVKLLVCEQLGGTFRIERRTGSTIARVAFPLYRKEADYDAIVDTDRGR